jgi:hypothetical protein
MSRLNLRGHVRRLPAGDLIVRATVFVLGAAFIVLGVALSVLPGPFTIPPVLVGLLIWSLEFDFARRWLDRVKVPAQEAWDDARARPVRAGLTLAASLALLVGGVVLATEFGVVGHVRDLVT